MAYKEVSVKQPLLLTILPYVSIIIFFAFWEGVVRSGIIPNTLLASPSQVFAAFIDKLSNPNPDGAIMATHAWTSIQEAFIGYVLSLVVGIPLGLAMGWFNVVEGLFRPIFELIRPIPPIAWIPLTVFWFGIGLAAEHDEVRIGIQPLPFRRTQGAQLLEFRFPETQYVTFQLQQPSRFPDAIRPSSHRVPMRNASCSIDYRQKDMPRHRCVAIRCGRPDS